MQDFRGFTGYSDSEIQSLWENAIFVVDTNILTNFYKYTNKDSYKNLLQILKKLKETNKLWIPHQVAIEYFFNYEKNMYKQKEGYEHLGKELRKFKEEVRKSLQTVKNAHNYINIEDYEYYEKGLESFNERLDVQLKEQIVQLPDSQIIKEDLLSLIDGIIGEPYSQQEIDTIEKQGEERYKHKIPPGFSDADSNGGKGIQDVRNYGGLRYHLVYGDLLVWNQLIDKAKDDSIPIIFMTEDRKPDWWEKEGNRIKRPHPQLIQEFVNETQQNFYMYGTDRFVELANKYLDINLTPEQVRSVSEDVESIRKEEETETRKVPQLKSEDQGIITLERLAEYVGESEIDDYEISISILKKHRDYEIYKKLQKSQFDQLLYNALPNIKFHCHTLIEEMEEYESDLAQAFLNDYNYYEKIDDLEGKVHRYFKLIDILQAEIIWWKNFNLLNRRNDL
ncbi:PIN-like domain-containing protein [Planomicrobium okeanokoites]|uniref:PIN-like domain-containing protein n=1 Tax=Planomicrobium okeanokoites TaxID=244 RepID=A0ABV7KLA6_PLAOK|nr:PIN-like domain-containing protein [Planomicrobium okeanokoites]TAA69384.1 hypothetical protein D2910_08575 [Planomicrobium okeanokoites]